MTTVVSTTRTDMFEQVGSCRAHVVFGGTDSNGLQLFQRLEMESEQRALAEEQESGSQEEVDSNPVTSTTMVDEVNITPVQEEAADAFPEPTTDATVRAAKERRRGSISISRFGQTTAEHTPTVSLQPSTRPSRSSSIVHTKTPFYQLEVKQPHVYTNSADSFASLDTSAVREEVHHEYEVVSSMVVEVKEKRSISKALSRRLSRARELPIPLPNPSPSGTLVIGVAVEEATVEHLADSDWHSVDNMNTTKVYSGTLRTRRSTPGLYQKVSASANPGSNTSASVWMSKAKDITSRFRRKSLAAFSNVTVSVGTVPSR